MPDPCGPVKRAVSGPPAASGVTRRAQEMLQPGAERDRLADGHRHRAAERERVAEHPPNHRPDEQLERDHGAHGVPWQPDPRRACQDAEAHRSAGAHPDAPELHDAPQLRENVAHQVVLSHAHPARRQEQVGARRPGEARPRLSLLSPAIPRSIGMPPARRMSANRV